MTKPRQRKPGVTPRRASQGEEGKARLGPTPVLLARLREIETSLEQGSSDHLTKREARAFKKRWAMVNAAERQDLAATPVAQKFRQLEALIVSARQLGWIEAPTATEGWVWERWARLRRMLHA
jgi:hypothetical protein